MGTACELQWRVRWPESWNERKEPSEGEASGWMHLEQLRLLWDEGLPLGPCAFVRGDGGGVVLQLLLTLAACKGLQGAR